jgi:heat shock protein HslJ
MKFFVPLCACLIILITLICGCSSQPAVTPTTPVPVAAGEVTPTHAAAATGPTLTGTNWQLGWFDDTKGVWSKVADGSTITAKFSADGKISGSGGCSDYVSDYQLTEIPKIWFRRPAVPDKVCQTPSGVMSQQSAYYTDLEWSQTYAIAGGQLIFFDKTGKKILQFDPVM